MYFELDSHLPSLSRASVFCYSYIINIIAVESITFAEMIRNIIEVIKVSILSAIDCYQFFTAQVSFKGHVFIYHLTSMRRESCLVRKQSKEKIHSFLNS